MAFQRDRFWWQICYLLTICKVVVDILKQLLNIISAIYVINSVNFSVTVFIWYQRAQYWAFEYDVVVWETKKICKKKKIENSWRVKIMHFDENSVLLTKNKENLQLFFSIQFLRQFICKQFSIKVTSKKLRLAKNSFIF